MNSGPMVWTRVAARLQRANSLDRLGRAAEAESQVSEAGKEADQALVAHMKEAVIARQLIEALVRHGNSEVAVSLLRRFVRQTASALPRTMHQMFEVMLTQLQPNAPPPGHADRAIAQKARDSSAASASAAPAESQQASAASGDVLGDHLYTCTECGSLKHWLMQPCPNCGYIPLTHETVMKGLVFSNTYMAPGQLVVLGIMQRAGRRASDVEELFAQLSKKEELRGMAAEMLVRVLIGSSTVPTRWLPDEFSCGGCRRPLDLEDLHVPCRVCATVANWPAPRRLLFLLYAVVRKLEYEFQVPTAETYASALLRLVRMRDTLFQRQAMPTTQERGVLLAHLHRLCSLRVRGSSAGVGCGSGDTFGLVSFGEQEPTEAQAKVAVWMASLLAELSKALKHAQL